MFNATSQMPSVPSEYVTSRPSLSKLAEIERNPGRQFMTGTNGQAHGYWLSSPKSATRVRGNEVRLGLPATRPRSNGVVGMPTSRAFPKFESYGMSETAAFRG